MNKDQSKLYKEVHYNLGIGYIYIAKEKHNQTIPDWTPQEIEKLGPVFKLENKDEAQEMFEGCYKDIYRAYVSVKEDLLSEKEEKLEV